MKTTQLLLLAVTLLLVGCQSAKIDVKSDKRNSKTENWEVTITQSVFSSANPDVMKACTALNDSVNQLLDSLQNAMKAEADTFFTTYAQTPNERPAFFYQLFSVDSVFMATDRYISLRTTIYNYSGGAHGMTVFYTLNYDVKQQKFLSLCEILACEKSAEINPLLEKHFDNEDGCFSEKPTLQTQGFSGVNLSESGVCFTYEHYALGAYACGYVQITVPIDEMDGMLKIKL